MNYSFNNKVLLKIKGKNIENFIKRLITKKIELLNIYYINRKEIKVEIYLKDYEKIKEMKTIYDIILLEEYGINKIKKVLSKNIFLILSIIISIGVIIFLSNVIFKIEVIHNDSEVRNFIIKELYSYGIKEKSIKKKFKDLEQIKKQVLEKEKDKIEWLEIENEGIKYVVRVVMRKLPIKPKIYPIQNVVAKKSAIITNIYAKNGTVVKNINDYVEKGDTVISGSIMLNETLKENTQALGTIYGEVWYTVKVTYPFIYNEKKYTGNTKNVYSIKFLNYRFDLFNFKKYESFDYNEQVIVYNNLMPLKLVKEKQKETKIISEVLTEEQAINKALEKAKLEMQSKLNDKEFVKYEKCLKVNIKDSKIELDVFFTVVEDITDYEKIVEVPDA